MDWTPDRQAVRYRALDLNLLAVFDALLRTGSVSRAAQELSRSQSAISHALAKLRDHYRDELFLKTAEGMIPTTLALEQAEAVRTFMLSAAAAATPTRGFEPTDLRGPIHLALSDMAALVVLPPLLPLLEAQAPAARLVISGVTGDELEAALANGQVDLAVSGPLTVSANILRRTLATDRLTVVVARDCPVAEPTQEADLAALREVAVTQPSTHRYRLDSLRSTLGLPPPAVTTPHALLVPHLVSGDGRRMAFLPETAARAACGLFPLRMLRTRFTLPELELVQYSHRRSRLDPMSRWLRDMVAAAICDRSR